MIDLCYGNQRTELENLPRPYLAYSLAIINQPTWRRDQLYPWELGRAPEAQTSPAGGSVMGTDG